MLKFEWRRSDTNSRTIPNDHHWIIPGLLESKDLDAYFPILDRLIENPLDEKGRRVKEGKEGKKKKRKQRRSQIVKVKGEEKGKKKRVTRNKKKKEEKQRFISDQFVHSSDDEDLDFNSEEARAFFAKEANIRKSSRKKAAEVGLVISDDDDEEDEKMAKDEDSNVGESEPKKPLPDYDGNGGAINGFYKRCLMMTMAKNW